MEHLLPDIFTGEMVRILDPMVPLEQKVDPISFYLEELDLQIKQCTDRKNIWNDKSNMLKDNKQKLRDYLASELSKTENRKLKTLENSLYFTSKSKEVLTVKEDELNPQCFDYSINITNLDLDTFNKIKEGLSKLKVKHTESKSVNLAKVDAKYKTLQNIDTLTIRKSANVKEQ